MHLGCSVHQMVNMSELGDIRCIGGLSWRALGELLWRALEDIHCIGGLYIGGEAIVECIGRYSLHWRVIMSAFERYDDACGALGISGGQLPGKNNPGCKQYIVFNFM